MRTPYRENENMGVTETIDDLDDRVAKLEKGTGMSGEQKETVGITGAIVTGLILLASLATWGGVSCNKADNVARVEAAKSCPAAATNAAQGGR